MACLFVPSLKLAVIGNVALTVYKDDISYFFDEFMGIDKVDADNLFHINERQKARMGERKKEIREKLSAHLPQILVGKVVNLLEPIAVEIYFWIRDHFHMIKHIEKRQYINNLRWDSIGTIDRTNTAKQLIRNESINKRVRFVLACIYFFEEDVRELWKSMKAKERKRISRIDSNVAVGFWMKLLTKKLKSPWMLWSTKYLTLDCLEPIIDYDDDDTRRSSRIRLNSFFFALTKAQRFFFLHSVWPKHAHIDDLMLSYYQTDEAERCKVMFSPSMIQQLLCFYLEWPFQTSFFKMLVIINKQKPVHCYENILQYIVDQKLSLDFHDYDYEQLIEDLWKCIPSVYRSQIQEKPMFVPICTILTKRKEENSRSIEEKLQQCRIEEK